MPRYFEDLAVGDRIVTPARTITEADVVQFAQLTGDTIRAVVTITETRLTSDGKRGIVGRTFAVHNQRDEIVQAGRSPVMVSLRPA
jgi:acyl dehydratase